MFSLSIYWFVVTAFAITAAIAAPLITAVTDLTSDLPIPNVSFSTIEQAGPGPIYEPLPGVRHEVVFTNSAGANRTYILYVPSTLADSGVAAPLVFSYHGFLSTPRQQELLCMFSPMAERRSFLVVYPEGTVRSHNSGPSCCPPAYPNVDDVQHARDIIQHINATLHAVDGARVYSTGMSNGGYMSTRLACDAADVFAAVASVAGGNPWPDMSNCQPSRRIPYLHFHGDSDPTVGYDHAVLTVDVFLQRNGCDLNSGVVTYNNGDSSCVAYSGCGSHGGQGLNNVTFCTVQGGLHIWPGNPVYQNGTLDLFASPHILDFFYRYTLY